MQPAPPKPNTCQHSMLVPGATSRTAGQPSGAFRVPLQGGSSVAVSIVGPADSRTQSQPNPRPSGSGTQRESARAYLMRLHDTPDDLDEGMSDSELSHNEDDEQDLDANHEDSLGVEDSAPPQAPQQAAFHFIDQIQQLDQGNF